MANRRFYRVLRTSGRTGEWLAGTDASAHHEEDTMLKSIRIRNYRGFRDCKIDDLGRVNIFAGVNNSGKTTILEALFLWSAGGNPQFAFNPTVVRVDVPVERALLPGPISNMMPNAGYMWSTAWQPMFHALATSEPIEIVGNHDPLGQMQLTISTERSRAVVLSPNSDTIRDHPDDLLFQYRYGGDDDSYVIRIKTRDITKYDVESTSQIKIPLQSIFEGMSSIATDVERLSKLKKEKADASVLNAIKMVDASVESIEIGVLDNHAVMLADVGLSDRLPLQTLGAGPQRIATLATSAAAAAGGLLLIDDFDAGLHYSKLGDVWRALHAIAVDKDVQVFATTHSYECVRAAHEVLGNGEPRFYRLQGGRAIDYPPDVLTDAIAAPDGGTLMVSAQQSTSQHSSGYNRRIHKPKLLLVEGKEDLTVFGELRDHWGLANIQIMEMGGITQLRARLGVLVRDPGFPNLQALGIARDADHNVQSAF